MDGDDYVYTGKNGIKRIVCTARTATLDEVYDPQDPPKREAELLGK